MKKPHKTDAHLNDDDIAHVFDAQNVVVPDDLKQSIFEQAELHSALDAKTTNNDGSGDDASYTGTEIDADNGNEIRNGTGTGTGNHSNKLTSFGSIPNWFAVAATVVIAVAVTPILLESPESFLEDNSPEFSSIVTADSTDTDTDTDTATSKNTSTTRSAASAVSEMTSTESDLVAPASKTLTAQPRALRQSANEPPKESANDQLISDVAQAPITFGDETQSASMAREAPAAAPVSSERPFGYRKSADKWINEIKIIIADGDKEKAEEEYRLFARQHPKRAEDFRPDFARRTIAD